MLSMGHFLVGQVCHELKFGSVPGFVVISTSVTNLNLNFIHSSSIIYVYFIQRAKFFIFANLHELTYHNRLVLLL